MLMLLKRAILDYVRRIFLSRHDILWLQTTILNAFIALGMMKKWEISSLSEIFVIFLLWSVEILFSIGTPLSCFQFVILVKILSILITWRFRPSRNSLNHEITSHNFRIIYVYALLSSVWAGLNEAMPSEMNDNIFTLVSKICDSLRRRYKR
jgi:hypothetical protein